MNISVFLFERKSIFKSTNGLNVKVSLLYLKYEEC